MDYGHTSQNDNNFFTAGAGADSSSAQTKNPELDDNLSLSNESANWNKIAAARNPRDFGNKVVNSQETIPSEAEIAPSGETELGKIVEVGMPPVSTSENKDTKTTGEIIEASFDRTVIKTDKKLSTKAINEVDKAVNKLGRDGNVADFYDTARDAMEANLDNSYNRKLAA